MKQETTFADDCSQLSRLLGMDEMRVDMILSYCDDHRAIYTIPDLCSFFPVNYIMGERSQFPVLSSEEDKGIVANHCVKLFWEYGRSKNGNKV